MWVTTSDTVRREGNTRSGNNPQKSMRAGSRAGITHILAMLAHCGHLRNGHSKFLHHLIKSLKKNKEKSSVTNIKNQSAELTVWQRL